MDIRQYDKKRDELVGFIDQALQLKCDLPERIRENLTAIRSKVYENQFRIVLISEFESGKSTTFNAICGGQEISPRGHNIRTSGTVVAAQNTLDSKKVNTADVIWRSDRELLLCFAKYLVQTVKELEPERFKTCALGEQLSSMLRLPQDIPLIRKAVEKRVQGYGRNVIEQGEEEALRIAWLICEFYDAPLLEQMKQKDHFAVCDVENMVCVPVKWGELDLTSGQNPLKVSDCIFLFVKEVKLYIQSESLKRSGSVIIDCPGLSASDYDTQVTFDIVENADAIWMLYNGMGMGKAAIEYSHQLMQLKNKSMFFTINTKISDEENIQNVIIPDCIKKMKKLNRDLCADDFHIYDALLALLALQAERFIDGTLDVHSINAIRSQVVKKQRDLPIEKIINTLVEKCFVNNHGISSEDLRDMNFDLFAKDKSGIAFVKKVSGLDKIVEKLENAVVEQKGQSILIDNGSEKVIELLKQVEADLQVIEQAALDDEETVRAEFEAAEEKLKQFVNFCENELEDLDDSGIDHCLALDYWERVIVSSIDEVAEKAAKKISEVNLNEIRRDANEQIVNEVFAGVVQPKATSWANSIRSGENATFNSLMDSKIKKIIRNTEEKWELLLEEQPLLSGLPVPTPVIGTDVMAMEFIDSVVAKTPGVSKDVWVGSATGAAIGATIGSFIFPGVGTWVGGILGGALGAAVGDGVGTDQRENFIRTELKRELMQNIVSEDGNGASMKRRNLYKQEKRMRSLREGIIKAFEDSFAGTRSAFASRQAEALKMYELEIAQRKALAERHSQLRKTQIEPLRKNIENFVNSVTNADETAQLESDVKATQKTRRFIMDVTKINEAVRAAQSVGWQMSGTIRDNLESMNNPFYRVFLAGEFQVGKSLLADQVFIGGSGLLRSGIGLPTTSVVTEVVYGENLSMEVVYRHDNAPQVISNPTAEDIAEYTTAKTEEERSSLSEKIEKVIITVPDLNLRKYAIMDSPGIDDSNEFIMMNSTLPQIQTADAVILVMPPRSLDSIEKKFLQGYLFEKSISRLMIMVSYDPKYPKSADLLKTIVEDIEADLQMMGREYIPVNVCCYDDSVDLELNSPEKIRAAIDAFAQENVEIGRIQRVAGILHSDFVAYANELRARLELNGAGTEEIERLRTQIKTAEGMLSASLMSTKSKVSSKESEIVVAMRDRLQASMADLKRQLMSRLENCESLGEVQRELLAVKNDMEQGLSRIFNAETVTAKQQIEEVLALTDKELAKAADELITTLNFGYEINSGHLGKLNPKLVSIVDYLLMSLISPFGLLFDVLIRYVLGKIPLIKNLLPAKFVRNRVVKTIEESLDEICEKVTCDIAAQFKQCFKRIEDDIESHFQLLYQTTVMPILKAIEEAEDKQLSAAEIAELKKKLNEMDNIVSIIQTYC